MRSFIFFFKLNLLRLHWLIKLYKFQVYSPIVRHLYSVLYVHHPKCSLLLPPFTLSLPSSNCPYPHFPLVVTILLSVPISFCSFFFFKHCYSITVFPISLLCPLLPTFIPTANPHTLFQSMDHSHMLFDYLLPLLSTIILLPPLLWPLSVCSMFPCLWFYFAC